MIERQNILTITRKNFRGADSEFVLVCEGVQIVIQPTRTQRYDLMEMMHGGGTAGVALPCNLRIKGEK